MNKKQSIKRGIWILLTVVWMAVIFGFSSDTADESSSLSLDVGKIICSIFEKVAVEGIEIVLPQMRR